MPDGRGSDARGNAQHFLVQQIGFRIFGEKTAPGASPEEGEDFGAGAEFFQHFVKTLADTRGQRPFEHLRVGSSGQIGAAKRDRKSTRLNSSHVEISYAVFC